MQDLYNFNIKRGYSKTTAAKNMIFIKGFLNWCLEWEYLTNERFKQYKVPAVKHPPKVIITPDEMERIRNLDLTSKPHLDNARGLFVLSCLTGLRFSDYSDINLANLKQDHNGDPYLSRIQEKTGDTVKIPLTPEAKKIVDDYLAGKYRSTSGDKMRKAVKHLCRVAGLNEPFEVNASKGHEDVVIHKPKWELVGTHTGRRTFATNLVIRGVPWDVAMQFTGHKSHKDFALYVNVPDTEKFDIVKKALQTSEPKLRIA
jgi:integrase